MKYSNNQKEEKCIEKTVPVTPDQQVDEQVLHKIIRFVNPSRQKLCFSNSVTTVLLNVSKFNKILSNEEAKFKSNNKIL